MTTFEKRPAGTTYDDHDSHRERDSYPERVSHQQHAGLTAAGNLMSTWTVAFYDYAEQVLKAQRQFADSVLCASASMLDSEDAWDVMSPDTNKGRQASQMDARDGQRREGFTRSRKNERYSDDDTAEYSKRSSDDNMWDDDTSDASRAERVNQTEKSAKIRARGDAR